ncbi:DUF421 domain-containing protein [Desulfonatronum parangueonense]
MEDIFFSGWETLARTIIVGCLAYVVLVFFLRISGRRTLSKMNAFDFVVTVALGSTLANILLNPEVSLAEGALAMGLLIGIQFVVTWSSVRAQWVKKVVTGEPALLFYRGAYLTDSLRKARVTRDEVRSAVRTSGTAALDEIEAVVLETDGSFSVVKRSNTSGESALAGIGAPGAPDASKIINKGD